jgi:hypothetical protein
LIGSPVWPAEWVVPHARSITGVLDIPMPRFGDNSEFLLKTLLAPLVISVVEMVERHFQLS